MGQLIVNTSVTPTQMIQNFVGTGVTISNITYSGGVNSKAIFTNGNTTNLSLTNGIILSTGTATQIANPASYLMSANLGLTGDANLNSINNGCLTYDACKLEFDFVPLSDTVKFRYVFGSEEYPNYICSQYNDVFAFFVSGPNPAGGTYTNYNIALIPGTNIPVSVNSVNSGIPGSSYSSSGCTSLAYSSYFVNNAAINGTTISFGGFTKPLIALCKVVPCQTYHIKLAVADGYNGLYDSGVFLEANSFTSKAVSVTNRYSDTTFGNNAVKGCTNATITFKTTPAVTSPFTINYTIGGTAVNGSDYTTIPTSVTIPTGQDSVTLLINPLVNSSVGPKYIILNITNGCAIIKDTIFILDKANLTVNVGNDTAVCLGKSATLQAVISGGIPPYTYLWGPYIATSLSPTVTLNATTNIYINVSDKCATTATDTVKVTIVPNPIVNLGNDTTLCSGNTLTLNAGNAGSSFLWNPSGNTQQINVSNSGTYSVKVTNSFGCVGKDSIKISFVSLNVNLGNNTSICIGDSIVLNAGTNATTYLWNTGATTSTIKVGVAGDYWVETKKGNCSSSDTITVAVAQPPVIFIGNDTIMCPGDLVTLDAGAGFDGYLWSNGSTQSSITINYPGIYSVSVNNGGCKASDEIQIGGCNSEIWVPNSFSPNDDGINDTFYPVCRNIGNLRMYIYNRWGNLIFEGAGDAAIWDGKYGGKICSNDIYYYLIKYRSDAISSTSMKQMHGSIMLLR